MRQAGVLTGILPESEKWGIDAIPGLIATEQELGWAPDPLLRLEAIVPPDPERLAGLWARLKLSSAEAARLTSGPRPNLFRPQPPRRTGGGCSMAAIGKG